MSSSIVFISHFRVKEGKREAFERYFREGTQQIQAAKPRTLVFLGFTDPDGTRATIVHVFEDAESMDRHVEGAEERSTAADKYLEPEGFELYGSPSDHVRRMLRGEGGPEGWPNDESVNLGGFLRVATR